MFASSVAVACNLIVTLDLDLTMKEVFDLACVNGAASKLSALFSLFLLRSLIKFI